MNPEKGSVSPEYKEQSYPSIEVGSYSDIEATIYVSLLEKKSRNEWGREQSEAVSGNLRDIEIRDELVEKFKHISALAHDNQETLKWIAFCHGNSDAAHEAIIGHIVRHKDIGHDEALQLMSAFEEFIQDARSQFSISGEVEPYVNEDIIERKKSLPELQARISKAIDFFKPLSSTVKKVVYLPSNPLEKIQSGNGVPIGDTFYISAERGNTVNEVHEFLHSFINPIVEKLSISQDDETALLALAPKRLQDQYGNGRMILIESIIRAYGDGFDAEKGDRFTQFFEQVRTMDRSHLAKVLSEVQKKGEIAAVSAEEFVVDADMVKAVYDRYVKNDAIDQAWKFLDAYQKSDAKNFEAYLIAHYGDLIENQASVTIK